MTAARRARLADPAALPDPPADLPTEARRSTPAHDALRGEIDALEESGCVQPGPWIALWQRAQGLPPLEAPAPGAPSETDLLRGRIATLTQAALNVGRFGDTVAAASQLVAAAAAVFSGQPDASAWPSRIGRIISVDVVVGDHAAFTAAMAAFTAHTEALDQAIAAARAADLLWLLPEGSLRCPLGADEILRSFAADANLISSPADSAGLNRLLGALALFSTPGRTQQTLASITAPFRQEMIEFAREATAQLAILRREGPAGTAELALAARPFRFRGVSVTADASMTYVLMIAFWVASGALCAVTARIATPLVTAATGLAAFGLSTVAALLPGRHARQAAWEDAIDRAEAAVAALQEALTTHRPRAEQAKGAVVPLAER